MHGVDHVIATTLEVKDGRYTGDVDFYAYGPNKARAMEQLAAERGYDLAESYAYSDSETDAPMLAAVGHPFAVNPDKELRRIAKERGWPVLVFERPVALGSRMKLPPAKPTLAALAITGLAGVGAAVWINSRRGRRSRFGS
jgi:phosphoserine phosphatase